QFAPGSQYPHFIGTLDGWLHAYTLIPFGHLFTKYAGTNGDRSVRIIGRESSADFLNAFKTRYQYAECGHVKANQYYCDLESESIIFDSGDKPVDVARARAKLFDWQQNDLMDTKRKFWKSGFATHQDVEFICHSVLKTQVQVRDRVAKRFPQVIVDE